jgi:hypothetical protein
MVRQNRRDLDNIVQSHPRGSELCFEVLPRDLGLFSDIFRDRSVFPHADLPADIERARGTRDFDRLRVGGCGGRCVGGVESANFHDRSLAWSSRILHLPPRGGNDWLDARTRVRALVRYPNEVRVNEVTRDVWDKSHSWTQKKAEAELHYPPPVASPTTRL